MPHSGSEPVSNASWLRMSTVLYKYPVVLYCYVLLASSVSLTGGENNNNNNSRGLLDTEFYAVRIPTYAHDLPTWVD